VDQLALVATPDAPLSRQTIFFYWFSTDPLSPDVAQIAANPHRKGNGEALEACARFARLALELQQRCLT
jgi:hypothetical protein